MKLVVAMVTYILMGVPGVGYVFADEMGNDVVLVSNARVKVTQGDFMAEIQRVPAENRFEFLASRERIGKVLEEILLMKTLASEAREAGLDNLPENRKKLQLAQDRVLSTIRITHLQQKAKLPDFDSAARESYRLNPEKYTESPMVKASHILIDTKNRNKDEALKLAQEVHTLALDGADFGELASKYSDDKGSKEKKGDLGYFAAGKMVKPFSDAAFAMKIGEISAPIETDFGFHLIKVEDVKLGRKLGYDSVKDKIKEELKGRYLAELKVTHMTNIRIDKDMIIHEDEIMKLKSVIPSTQHAQ